MSESEISIINRLAAERQDNVMWREFRAKLLRNMGLVRHTAHTTHCDQPVLAMLAAGGSRAVRYLFCRNKHGPSSSSQSLVKFVLCL